MQETKDREATNEFCPVLLRRVFTLTELLLIIAVVVILASLLLPAIARGREQANRTCCAQQLGWIVKSIKLYASDHSNLLPAKAGRTPARAVNLATSAAELGCFMRCNYLTDAKIFRCPSRSPKKAPCVPYRGQNDGWLDYCYHGAGYVVGEIGDETCLIRDYGAGWEVNPNHCGLYLNAAYGDGHVEGKYKYADYGNIVIVTERGHRTPSSILVMPGGTNWSIGDMYIVP